MPPSSPDRVELGQELEQAGYSFGQCGPWFGSGKTRPVDGAEAQQLLEQKKSVEVKTPRGYEQLFDFAELEAMHALWAGKSELAQAMKALEAHNVRFGDRHESRTQAYARLSQGKPVIVAVPEKQDVLARSVDEIKLIGYLQGYGTRAEDLAHPERARSVKLLAELGLAGPLGSPKNPLHLYPSTNETHRLGRFEIASSELDDSAALAARLAPLKALLGRIQDPQRAHEAESMLRAVESDRPLSEKLDRVEFAFSFPGFGSPDLYRALLEQDQTLEQARAVRSALGPAAQSYDTRDALVYLRKLPSQEQDYLRLLELSKSPRWASETLRKLGANPSAEQLESAAWARMKWSHPTSILTARKPFGDASLRERELGLTRVYADSNADMAAAKEVWGELRRSGASLPEALQAHDLLSEVMGQIRAVGPGWWEAECLATLRQERREGGALQGLTLVQSVERLLPFLHRGAEGILLKDHSAKEVVEGALSRLKSGESVRTGVEERNGGVIVGGVRVGVREGRSMGDGGR